MAEMIRELESALMKRAKQHPRKPIKAFISLESADDPNTLAFYKRMGFQARNQKDIMELANSWELPQLILPVGSYDGKQVRFAVNQATAQNERRG